MNGRFLVPARASALTILATLAMAACGSDSTTPAEHKVFFVGYAYDGASGARLDKAAIDNVSILYGDKTILFDIADDGRFVSRDPLPTWRDYTVKIDAAGYRSFASYNAGIDVPASLAMTNGLAEASTTQTLDFSAYLFPVSLKAPKFTLSITIPDAQTGAPVTYGVEGKLRLRPQSSSSILIGSSATSPAKRVWANSEDLLTQSIEKAFTEGTAVMEEGEMVYGVAYELTVFDVDGYQPLIFSASSSSSSFGTVTNPPIIAGTVTSETFTLTQVAQDPLRIVASDAYSCVPPSPTSSTYGGKLTLTFNYDVEVVGNTFAEDLDNSFGITLPQPTTTSYCSLRSPTGDPMQERGSKIEIGTNTLTFSFNPTVGIATTGTFSCTLPPGITSIMYYTGNIALSLQPKGQPLRKRTLSSMLSEKLGTSQLSCPQRSSF